jgi:alanine dehydrogenase
VTTSDVRAELSDVVVGRRPGRTSVDEIIVFDSTGTAIQDVASAAWIYERALASNVGLRMRLAALPT